MLPPDEARLSILRKHFILIQDYHKMLQLQAFIHFYFGIGVPFFFFNSFHFKVSLDNFITMF